MEKERSIQHKTLQGGLSHNWIYSVEAGRRTKQLSFGLFEFQTRHGPRNGKDQSV